MTAEKKNIFTKIIVGEKATRSVMKAISWRFLASFTTFIVTLLVARELHFIEKNAVKFSLWVTLFEATSKMVLYFFHERIWLRIHYGKVVFKKDSPSKK